jgi:archaellum component FlaG (FlaF/FlaG flagellin family)
MRLAVIDRVESERAVVLFEGETQPQNIRLADLPMGVKEGDHLQIEMQDGEVVRAEIVTDAKAEAEKRIQVKLERLRRGDHLKGKPPSDNI